MNLSKHNLNEILYCFHLNKIKITYEEAVAKHLDNNNLNKKYKLLVVTTNYDCLENKQKINKNVLKYYIINYSCEDLLFCDLSVLDCGGYYIAVGLFCNNQNITNKLINRNSCSFNMNTIVTLNMFNDNNKKK